MKSDTLRYAFHFLKIKNTQTINNVMKFFNFQFWAKVRSKFTVKPWKMYNQLVKTY